LLEIPDRDKKLLYFVAMDDARFRRPVVPGDQLRIEMKLLFWRRDFCKLEGRATVDGHLCAEATLMCRMVDRDDPADAPIATVPNESAAPEHAKVAK
jgi:3-hydroxyacyl-[acyl-carrier-protein] dehydratase